MILQIQQAQSWLHIRLIRDVAVFPSFLGLTILELGMNQSERYQNSQDKALEVAEKLAAGTPDVSRWTKCFSALREKRDLQFDQDISV